MLLEVALDSVACFGGEARPAQKSPDLEAGQVAPRGAVGAETGCYVGPVAGEAGFDAAEPRVAGIQATNVGEESPYRRVFLYRRQVHGLQELTCGHGALANLLSNPCRFLVVPPGRK